MPAASHEIIQGLFVFCAVLGTALLVVADIVDIGLDLDLTALHIPGSGDGHSSGAPFLLGFIGAFGVGGLLGANVLGLDDGGAARTGLAFGLVGATLAALLFALLHRAEADEPSEVASLVGRAGQVSIGIPAKRNGAVLIELDGQAQSFTATSVSDLPAGAAVRVISVVGQIVTVEPSSKED